MKNILAENLLRFGVRNLSEADRKTLMTEAVSAAGSYKTQTNNGIVTGTISVNGNTLSFTLGNQLVGSWTLNSPVKPGFGAFTFQSGPGNTGWYDKNGNLTANAKKGASISLLGIDKALLTAASEAVKNQPEWNKPIDPKNPKVTYSAMILDKFRIEPAPTHTNGIMNYLSFSTTIPFGAEKQYVKVMYSPISKEFTLSMGEVQRTAKSIQELTTQVQTAVQNVWSRANGQANMNAKTIDPIVKQINGLLDKLNTSVTSL